MAASRASSLACSSVDSWVIMASACACSWAVGMPVTPSRMTPHTASSARVSVMSAAVTTVLPAGRRMSARHRSYTSAVRMISGAVGLALSGVPVSTVRLVFLAAASYRSTSRSMRLRTVSAAVRVTVSGCSRMMLRPRKRAGRTHACPALTVTVRSPFAVTAKSSSALYTPLRRVLRYPEASSAS